MDVSLLSPDMIAFGPDMLKLIEIELETRKISYRELACKLHTATGTIGSWFSRGQIPADKMWPVIAAVESPRLWQQALGRIPGNVFQCRYLDLVDDHPFAAIQKACSLFAKWSELSIAAKDAMQNKKPGYQFSGLELEAIRAFQDLCADMITNLQTILIRLEERWGLKVSEVHERHTAKLEEHGHCTPIKRKTASGRSAVVQ